MDSILELNTQAYSEPLSKASFGLSPDVDSVREWTPKVSQCVNCEPEILSETVERGIAQITVIKTTVKKRKKRNCYYRPRKRK